MTEQEARQKGEKKLKTLFTLCEQLQLNPIAKQRISQDGTIEMIVVYNDMENYPIKKDDNAPIVREGEVEKEVIEDDKGDEPETDAKG